MAITIKDVAKAVGVAPSTVSRVLKDSPAISLETKEKVRKAMKKLGYVPNIAAQNLVRGLTNSIGVIFPPMDQYGRNAQPFFMQVLSVINDEAIKKGVTIAISTGHSQAEILENVTLMHKQKRVDGFLMLYSASDDPVREYLIANNSPYAMIGTPISEENATVYVDTDNQLLGKNAVDYLTKKGHKKILFVTDTLEDGFLLERYFGYTRGMQVAQLTPEDPLYFNHKDAGGILDFQEKLAFYQPTALFVTEDILALRLIQFLQFIGYHVPDDISIVSINNTTFTELIHPYLTSFDIGVTELGKMAFNRLMAVLHQPEESYFAKVLVPHKLIERESVRLLMGEAGSNPEERRDFDGND